MGSGSYPEKDRSIVHASLLRADLVASGCLLPSGRGLGVSYAWVLPRVLGVGRTVSQKQIRKDFSGGGNGQQSERDS